MNKTLFLILSLALLWGCMDDPFENHSLQLEAEAGVTEAWLSLHVEGLKSDAVYTLQRNGAVIFNSRLQTADTVIYDSLLTPATSYRYRFFAVDRGETSPAVETTLTTLDTTSHDFDWQVYTFGGQKGTSLFYDVAIIDENDIWAVGEIYTADTYTYDSLGNWIDPYNAAHWDGEKWTLLHVNGNGSPIHVIQAFTRDDIWFQGVLHWDGQKYTLHNKNFPLLSNGDGWRMNKMWGTSPSDFYVVGNKGMMAHYDGTGWTKIETGTELDIQDIWGVTRIGEEPYILAVTKAGEASYKPRVFQISNRKANSLFVNLYRNLYTVWFKSPRRIFAGGSGLFYKWDWDYSWLELKQFAYPVRITSRIRGTDLNHIMASGERGSVLHFNGKSWREIAGSEINEAIYFSLDVKAHLTAVVGSDYNKATITLLRHIP